MTSDCFQSFVLFSDYLSFAKKDLLMDSWTNGHPYNYSS